MSGADRRSIFGSRILSIFNGHHGDVPASARPTSGRLLSNSPDKPKPSTNQIRTKTSNVSLRQKSPSPSIRERSPQPLQRSAAQNDIASIMGLGKNDKSPQSTHLTTLEGDYLHNLPATGSSESPYPSPAKYLSTEKSPGNLHPGYTQGNHLTVNPAMLPERTLATSTSRNNETPHKNRLSDTTPISPVNMDSARNEHSLPILTPTSSHVHRLSRKPPPDLSPPSLESEEVLFFNTSAKTQGGGHNAHKRDHSSDMRDLIGTIDSELSNFSKDDTESFYADSSNEDRKLRNAYGNNEIEFSKYGNAFEKDVFMDKGSLQDAFSEKDTFSIKDYDYKSDEYSNKGDQLEDSHMGGSYTSRKEITPADREKFEKLWKYNPRTSTDNSDSDHHSGDKFLGIRSSNASTDRFSDMTRENALESLDQKSSSSGRYSDTPLEITKSAPYPLEPGPSGLARDDYGYDSVIYPRENASVSSSSVSSTVADDYDSPARLKSSSDAIGSPIMAPIVKRTSFTTPLSATPTNSSVTQRTSPYTKAQASASPRVKTSSTALESLNSGEYPVSRTKTLATNSSLTNLMRSHRQSSSVSSMWSSNSFRNVNLSVLKKNLDLKPGEGERSNYVLTIRRNAGTAVNESGPGKWKLPTGILPVDVKANNNGRYARRVGGLQGKKKSSGVELKHGHLARRLLAAEIEEGDESRSIGINLKPTPTQNTMASEVQSSNSSITGPTSLSTVSRDSSIARKASQLTLDDNSTTDDLRRNASVKSTSSTGSLSDANFGFSGYYQHPGYKWDELEEDGEEDTDGEDKSGMFNSKDHDDKPRLVLANPDNSDSD